MGVGAGQGKSPYPDKSNKISKSHCTNSSMSTCESCMIKFSILKKKNKCHDCGRFYCSACLKNRIKIGSFRCGQCQNVIDGNFSRQELTYLKIVHLRTFLQSKNISTELCKEKSDFVDLIFEHFGSIVYHRSQFEHGKEINRLAEKMRHVNNTDGSPRSIVLGGTPRSMVVVDELDNTIIVENSEDEDECDIPVSREINAQDNVSTPNQTEEMDTVIEEILIDTSSAVVMEVTETTGHQTAQDSTSSSVHNVQDEALTVDNGQIMTLERVTSLEQLGDLSVRQLKELLVCNFVNYRGCCERWELEERVRRLWLQKQDDLQKEREDRENNDLSNESEMCKICMDAVIDCVLLECGHMLTCTKCGKQLSECPVCRQYVVRAVHTFRS